MPPKDLKQRDDIINNAQTVEADKRKWINWCLRIPEDLLLKIDQSVQESGITKTSFILQAIVEKLKSSCK